MVVVRWWWFNIRMGMRRTLLLSVRRPAVKLNSILSHFTGWLCDVVRFAIVVCPGFKWPAKFSAANVLIELFFYLTLLYYARCVRLSVAKETLIISLYSRGLLCVILFTESHRRHSARGVDTLS